MNKQKNWTVSEEKVVIPVIMNGLATIRLSKAISFYVTIPLSLSL